MEEKSARNQLHAMVGKKPKMKIGQKILQGFKEGKKPKDLIEQGYNKTTVYKFWKVYQPYEELKEKLWEIIWLSA